MKLVKDYRRTHGGREDEGEEGEEEEEETDKIYLKKRENLMALQVAM
jgi:hypothetical protein